MSEVFKGTVELSEGVEAALDKALSEADRKKPPRVGAVGYQYKVESISGTRGGSKGDTLSVEIETNF